MEAIDILIGQGAEVIILGCTELSLLPIEGEVVVPVVDPLQILADVVVRNAKVDL